MSHREILYRKAVEFIALNDEDSNLTDTEALSQQLTVVLVSEVFGVSEKKVAADVMAARTAEVRSRLEAAALPKSDHLWKGRAKL